jgi:hypothetical protein
MTDMSRLIPNFYDELAALHRQGLGFSGPKSCVYQLVYPEGKDNGLTTIGLNSSDVMLSHLAKAIKGA